MFLSKFAIRSIDKAMIGLPTNFQHCAHIGCSDIVATNMPTSNSTFNNPGFIDVHNYQLGNNNNSVKVKNNNQSALSNVSNSGQPFVSHMKLIDIKTA
jgi:hypothetical protein